MFIKNDKYPKTRDIRRTKRIKKLIGSILDLVVVFLMILGIHTYLEVYELNTPKNTADLMCIAPDYDPEFPPVKQVVGLVLDGSSVTNTKVLRATLVHLVRLGWFCNIDIPESSQFIGTRYLWDWAVWNMHSNYLDLRKTNVWDFEWDEAKVSTFRKQLATKKEEDKCRIDLIIGFGNMAGKLLADSSLTSNIVILNAKNPETMGYTQGNRFSTKENLFVARDPEYSAKQIRLFYNVTGFSRLGILYRGSDSGRADAGVQEAYKLSTEYGFDVIPYPLFSEGRPLTTMDVRSGVSYLSNRADAIFIPELPGISKYNINDINIPILEQKIPTFSQQGKDLVSRGFLLSYNYIDYTQVGQFNAAAIGAALNGVKLNTLSQKYSYDLEVYINKDTADKINYRIPKLVQRAANTIYTRTLLDVNTQ